MEGSTNELLSIRSFNYKELETFGQLMISMSGVCSRDEALDMSSCDVIREIARLAVDFEAEWSRISDDDHEELKEDWLEEVDKLGDWAMAHLYDVLHNCLEYGGYRARRRVWGVVAKGEPPCNWWASFDNAVSDMLCQANKFACDKCKERVGHADYSVSLSVIGGGAKAIVTFYTNHPFDDEDYEFKVISKLEELQ